MGRTGCVNDPEWQVVDDRDHSKAWQSGPSVGYPEGPLTVVTLSAADIEKYCKCTFFGNGNYNPECTGR
jgi:hypothetical protein